jgi:hypothetical protein
MERFFLLTRTMVHTRASLSCGIMRIRACLCFEFMFGNLFFSSFVCLFIVFFLWVCSELVELGVTIMQ